MGTSAGYYSGGVGRIGDGGRRSFRLVGFTTLGGVDSFGGATFVEVQLPVAQELLGSFEGGGLRRYAEDYEGVRYQTLQNPDRPAQNFEFTVPEGQYFGMGDNRDGSSDSRYWGTIPEAYLKGRAFFIWMSWDSEANRPALSRIGQVIR